MFLNYPLKRKRVASNRPRPSRGATFRRRYEFVKSVTRVNYVYVEERKNG